MSKTAPRIAVGALVAAAAGYVAGILTAPKSGKETREDIHKAALKAKTESEKKLKEVHSDLGNLIDEAKKRVSTLGDRSSKELQQALDAAKKSKDAARSALSAFHEGGLDDRELKAAIKDAGAAADHLKKFIEKSAKKQS